MFTKSEVDEDLVEEEEFCCACMVSRNILNMCGPNKNHLCCKECHARNVYEEALAYYADYENFIDFSETCMICCEPGMESLNLRTWNVTSWSVYLSIGLY